MSLNVFGRGVLSTFWQQFEEDPFLFEHVLTSVSL